MTDVVQKVEDGLTHCCFLGGLLRINNIASFDVMFISGHYQCAICAQSFLLFRGSEVFLGGRRISSVFVFPVLLLLCLPLMPPGWFRVLMSAFVNVSVQLYIYIQVFACV